jgi:hypothetical protein
MPQKPEDVPGLLSRQKKQKAGLVPALFPWE